MLPTWGWREWGDEDPWHWHNELRYFHHGLATEHGRLLKGYSVDGVELLRNVVERAEPLMEHFGIHVAAFYQNRSLRTQLGAYGAPIVYGGVELPASIILSTAVGPGAVLPILIHELAHDEDCRRLGQCLKPRGMALDTYQAQFHGERFRRRFGVLLAHYLEHYASPAERADLTFFARTTYASPIHPEGFDWF